MCFFVTPLSAGPFQPRECVAITGNDPVAVSSGLHHYLKYVANCSVSWLGDQLQNIEALGQNIPIPAEPIVMTSTYEFRYYMNACTFGCVSV